MREGTFPGSPILWPSVRADFSDREKMCIQSDSSPLIFLLCRGSVKTLSRGLVRANKYEVALAIATVEVVQGEQFCDQVVRRRSCNGLHSHAAIAGEFGNLM